MIGQLEMAVCNSLFVMIGRSSLNVLLCNQSLLLATLRYVKSVVLIKKKCENTTVTYKFKSKDPGRPGDVQTLDWP